MRNWIKKQLFRMGYEIHRNSEFRLLRENAFEVQKFLIGKNSGIVVFDLGAFNGSTALRYHNLFPSSTVYCFEPFPASYSQLVNRTKDYDNIKTWNIAISDRCGFQDFKSNSYSQTNSLFATHKNGEETWGHGLLETIENLRVETSTIDVFLKSEKIDKIDILKIDVQGAEFLVLKGANQALIDSRINLIYTEIILLPTYEGQKSLQEILAYLEVHHYVLHNLFNFSYTNEGQLRQVDAIFSSKHFQSRKSSR